MSLVTELLDRIIALCDEKKAQNIRSYHLTGNSFVTDYVVIMSASNAVHARALTEEVEKDSREFIRGHASDDFYDYPKVSGNADSGWVVVDLNSIVIHIITPELREHYDLDSLFEKRSVVYHH